MRHGTVSGYQYHRCRCRRCLDAKNRYQRELRAGVRRPLVDATVTRDHLHALKAAGWSWAALAKHTGYDHTAIAAIANGTTHQVRQSTAQDLASVPIQEKAT